MCRLSNDLDSIVTNSVDEVLKYIKEQGAKRILIQVANGFKNRGLTIFRRIMEKDPSVEIFLDGDHCYGACDIPVEKIKALDIDLLIHIGHVPFKYSANIGVPIIYMPLFEDAKDLLADKVIDKAAAQICNLAAKYRVTLLYTLQFYPIYKRIAQRIQTRADHSTFLTEPYEGGLVIGCEVSAAQRHADRTDIFIVIGSGKFHALGVALWTGKRTCLYDIYRQELIELERDRKKLLSLILARIERARDAKRIGIITVNKLGQFNPKLSRKIYRHMVELGKEAYHLVLTDIKEEKLQYFIDVDAFIQTGCPRISIDDQENFSKPVLNYEQYLIMVGEKKFEEVYPL